jgi:spermidine synthase
LITAEAFRLYRRHLRPDGILAVNISNKFLDFEPVVRALAADNGMNAIRIDSNYHPEEWITPAAWMLLSGNTELLAALESQASPAAATGSLWTDDYANVMSILR